LTGATTASFTYDPLARRAGKTINGNTTNFVYDGVYSVQELTGGTPTANLLTGLGVEEVFSRLDSLGIRHASGEVNANAVQYTGRENDGTGLYYCRARYYQPGLSRFVAQDPIGLVGGVNAYAYVGGNPVSYIDPDGKQRARPYYGEPKTWYMHPITAIDELRA